MLAFESFRLTKLACYYSKLPINKFIPQLFQYSTLV